ncbi:hypothetical protein CIP107566_00294 [Corynebacterium diphtheriae]|nr:hypothetical protein CIP107566_00294 [Corynebacterium diphtheriae]
MLLYEDARMRAVEILRSLPIGNSGVSGIVQLAATLGASGGCPIVCVRGLGLQVVRESVGVSHG